MKAEWRDHVDALLEHTNAILRLSQDIFDRRIEYTASDKTELMILGYAADRMDIYRQFRIWSGAGIIRMPLSLPEPCLKARHS